MVGITVFHPLSQWRQRLETRNPEIRLPSSVDVIETSCRREREIRHRLQAAAAEPLKPNVAGGEEPPAIGRLPSTPLLLDGGPVVDSAAAAPPQGEAVGRGGDRRRPQRARRRRLPRPRRPLRRRARAPWRPRRRRRLRVRPRPGLPLLPLQLPPQPPPPRPDPVPPPPPIPTQILFVNLKSHSSVFICISVIILQMRVIILHCTN